MRYCLFLFLFANNLQAQVSAIDSSYASPDSVFAKQIYFSQRGEEAAIYSGRQFNEYSSSIEGHGYFMPAWQIGSVIYDKVHYEQVYMKYDLVKDQLIVAPKGPNEIFISLFSPRVSGFSFNSNHFFRVNEDGGEKTLPAGFYQELEKGKLTFLAKRSKQIKEKIQGTILTQRFEEYVKYYLCKTGTCFQIKNEKDIYKVVDDQRKELHQFMSKNKLKYRKDPEKTIQAAAAFYNQSGH